MDSIYSSGLAPSSARARLSVFRTRFRFVDGLANVLTLNLFVRSFPCVCPFVQVCREKSTYTANMDTLERNDVRIPKRCERCGRSRYNVSDQKIQMTRKDSSHAFEMFLREMAAQNCKITCPSLGPDL
jgi:ribosomal protein S14